MNKLFLGFRSLVFYIGYILLLFWFGATGPLFSFFPHSIRTGYILTWNRLTITWLKLTCNIHVHVIGKENIPNEAYVALSKHQSQWETFFLQY